MHRRISCPIAAAAAALILTVPTLASADLFVGGGAGALVPWKGGAGYSSIGQVLTELFTSRIRIGGEFEYRSYQTQFLGLSQVDVNSYNARAVLHAVLFPDMLTPYAGVALGVTLIDLDDPRIDAAFGGTGADTFGFGYGGVAFAGLQLPLGDHFSLFSEARTGIAFDRKGDLEDQLGSRDLSGFTGVLGVRMSF